MFPSAIFNICIVLIIASKFSLTIGASREVVSNINTTSCGDKIERLEHVEAHITFECTRRGEVELFLTSAQGTKSKLLTKRQKDNSSATSFSWKFMSVHYWGENPSGTWSLKMRVKESSFTGKYPFSISIVMGKMNLWSDKEVLFRFIVCFLFIWILDFLLYSVTFCLGSLTKWKLVFFGTKDNQNIKMNENDSLITGNDIQIASMY